MTEKALVAHVPQSLLVGDSENEIKNMTRKIMKLVPGGSRLNPEQSVELAVFCYVNALNPFNGEAYYLPGAGPVPGVMAYRNRAQNELEAQAGPTARFWFEYFPAEEGEADFDPEAGDIAYRAVLHESVAEEAYQRRLLEFYLELKKAGIEDAWPDAQRIVGEAPTWQAVGVVDHREEFTRGDKPDKWDRHERAKKRAEKWAIKKRFSRITFPDAELGEKLSLDPGFIDGIVADVQAERPPREPEEIIAELGFDVEQPPRQWPKDLIERALRELDEHYRHKNHVVGALNKSPFVDELELDYVAAIDWLRERKSDQNDGQK